MMDFMNQIQKRRKLKVELKVTRDMVIVMTGLAKIYVGNIVETARGVMVERGESGPIMPRHLREAYQRTRKRIGGRAEGTPGALVHPTERTTRR